jgi:tetratricopeptide (TPR) repeat protein
MEVFGMDENEAISLLLKSATIVDNSKQNVVLASKIVSELGYIPLAIDQAGAYLQACDIGLDDYLDLYYNRCRELMADSIFEGASNYGRSTYGTWEISMKEIESRARCGSGPESLAAQSAVILYKYFAFMHHDGISEEIFKTAAENYKKRDIEQEKSLGLPLLVVLIDPKALFLDESGLWNRHQFQAGIQVLISFALIKSSNKLYSIHPLVHTWSRNRISGIDVSVGYHTTAALLSCAIEPDDYIDNYVLCMQILPHIKSCHTHALKLKLEIMTFDDECDRFAFSFYRAGNWAEAIQLRTVMMEARKAKLGVDHTDTLWSTRHLAAAYFNQGRFDEAKKLELQVLDARKAKLGANGPDALVVSQSIHSLAVICHRQGRYDEAEKLHLQVLDTTKAILGADHTDTLFAMYNLAVIYCQQGRWDEAEELELQVLAGRKAKLGADHPDTLSSMDNLAMTYHDQGRFDEAEKLHLWVFNASKAKLGADHPDTFWSMHSLAVIYHGQGKMEEAEKLQSQVFNARKAKLGADHPDTFWSMHSLAVIYHGQGKMEEAEKLQLQVLDARKAKLGADHPDTLSSMDNLAMTYHDQGKFDEAEKLQLQILDSRRAKLGADHPDSFWSMHNLAVTYHGQGRVEEAENLQLQVLDGRKEKLGADHPDTLSSMQHLADISHDQARIKEAQKLDLQEFHGERAKLGGDHHQPDNFTFMHHLEVTDQKQSRLKKLKTWITKTKVKVGVDHPGRNF